MKFYVVIYDDPDGICQELFTTNWEANRFVKMVNGKIYEVDHIYYMETKEEEYSFYTLREMYFSTKDKAKAYLIAHPEQKVSKFVLLKPPIDLDSEIQEFEENI